jgi:hypothetical protein
MNAGAVSAYAIATTPITTAPVPAAPTPAPAANVTAAAAVAASKPFLNPALADIAAKAAITTNAPPPLSATDPVLYGDSALLIQSYGAVALLSGPQNSPAMYGLPAAPAVTPVDAI